MRHKCAEITASTILHRGHLCAKIKQDSRKKQELSELQANASLHATSQHSRNDHINDIQMYSQVTSTLNVHSQVFK